VPAGGSSASIIDVGGGESTLVDDLLAKGYEHITVLDISQTAIDVTRARLKAAPERVHWITADITKVELEPMPTTYGTTALSFIFLRQRAACRIRPAGCPRRQAGWPRNCQYLRLEGPSKCSGLDVVRYDAESLHDQFGVRFRLG